MSEGYSVYWIKRSEHSNVYDESIIGKTYKEIGFGFEYV